MGKSVIVSAARTPFAKFGGALKDYSATDLGAIAIQEALLRSGVDNRHVDEVLMGMVLQAGSGQIPSRQAAMKAGLGWCVHTETINKVCASGLRAVTLADQIIRAGDAEVIVAGGMESMSNAPYAIKTARFGTRMGDATLLDLMIHDGLTCAFDQVHMAVHGSRVAEEFAVTRAEQDAWALRSQLRAAAAITEGKLTAEIVPVTLQERNGMTQVIDQDEPPRPDTSAEKLAALAPIMTKSGTITAGNAPGVNDGAGAFVVMSEEKALALGTRPLATILAHVAVGESAPYLATAPGHAINQLLQKTGFHRSDIDLVEINEAFASVVLTSATLAEIDHEKINVNGGAIAFGHPIGASGARILMTLIYELKRRGGGLGIAAICSGGGQGDAVLVQVH